MINDKIITALLAILIALGGWTPLPRYGAYQRKSIKNGRKT